MPVAIAPDETRMTSLPFACAAASASTSGSIWPTFGPLIDDEPTLTTMRRAPAISEREVRLLVTVDREPFVVVPDSSGALGFELGARSGLRIHAFKIACPLGLARLSA